MCTHQQLIPTQLFYRAINLNVTSTSEFLKRIFFLSTTRDVYRVFWKVGFHNFGENSKKFVIKRPKIKESYFLLGNGHLWMAANVVWRRKNWAKAAHFVLCFVSWVCLCVHISKKLCIGEGSKIMWVSDNMCAYLRC